MIYHMGVAYYTDRRRPVATSGELALVTATVATRRSEPSRPPVAMAMAAAGAPLASRSGSVSCTAPSALLTSTTCTGTRLDAGVGPISSELNPTAGELGPQGSTWGPTAAGVVPTATWRITHD